MYILQMQRCMLGLYRRAHQQLKNNCPDCQQWQHSSFFSLSLFLYATFVRRQQPIEKYDDDDGDDYGAHVGDADVDDAAAVAITIVITASTAFNTNTIDDKSVYCCCCRCSAATLMRQS